MDQTYNEHSSDDAKKQINRQAHHMSRTQLQGKVYIHIERERERKSVQMTLSKLIEFTNGRIDSHGVCNNRNVSK